MKLSFSLILALSIGLIAGGSSIQAQSVATVPSGYFTLNIAAGTGTTSVTSVVSLPLQGTPFSTGHFTGVTANTLSDSSANWTAGQLSQSATPYYIRITSGSAIGRTFIISTSTANTSTTLTIDTSNATGVDLTQLGIQTGASGDSYEIVPADTISTIFGTPATTGVLGSSSPSSADIVQLFVSGAWRKYYYNTSSNNWLQVGPNINSNNVVIRPDSGVMYSRLAATSLSLTLMGRVPSITNTMLVSNSGVTFTNNSWPADLTLATSSINLIPGWISSSSPSSADIVQCFVSGAWRKYYYDGSNWRQVGPNIISNSLVLPAGSGIILDRKGTSGTALLTQALPYTL